MPNHVTARRRLESYATVLELLRDVGPGDCDRILQVLQSSLSLEEAVNTVQKEWAYPSEELAIP